MIKAGGMTWQAISMANIFPSTWIQLSKIQVHSHDLHLMAILAFSPAKQMMVLSAFEIFHPHLCYLCRSVLHLIIISACAGSHHLKRSFGRERLPASFMVWDRCFSKCLFCGGLQRQLSAFVGYLQTQKIEVAQTVFFLQVCFLAASSSISNSHKEKQTDTGWSPSPSQVLFKW